MSGSAISRRDFLRRLLQGVGLSIFGAVPVACADRWSLLPPRPVPWTMKPLGSAKTEESVLADGRMRLRIEHEPLRGVSPAMLVWWWRNIAGDIELGSARYLRYLIWHPVDHIHFELAARAADGSTGPGAVFHIVEALGADMKNLIDAELHLMELHAGGALVEVRALAQAVVQIRGEFLPHASGTQVVSTMTIGSAGWLGALGLNQWLIERYFPAERRRAWLRHSVEEIGNLEFFLPGLHRRYAAVNSSAHVEMSLSSSIIAPRTL